MLKRNIVWTKTDISERQEEDMDKVSALLLIPREEVCVLHHYELSFFRPFCKIPSHRHLQHGILKFVPLSRFWLHKRQHAHFLLAMGDGSKRRKWIQFISPILSLFAITISMDGHNILHSSFSLYFHYWCPHMTLDS